MTWYDNHKSFCPQILTSTTDPESQIDHSEEYCFQIICQKCPKKPNICGTISCKTKDNRSPKCLRAQRQGCVRLAQTMTSLYGDWVSLKVIPAIKYGIVTIRHKINTMTSCEPEVRNDGSLLPSKSWEDNGY